MRKITACECVCALIIMVSITAFRPASAQSTAANAYPEMAPIEQYLMDRTAEIELARDAAPESISRDAEVLVLGRHGFETAVKGKNGFVCIVGRGWSSAADPDFWNPKVRVPMCECPGRTIVPSGDRENNGVGFGGTQLGSGE